MTSYTLLTILHHLLVFLISSHLTYNFTISFQQQTSTISLCLIYSTLSSLTNNDAPNSPVIIDPRSTSPHDVKSVWLAPFQNFVDATASYNTPFSSIENLKGMFLQIFAPMTILY